MPDGKLMRVLMINRDDAFTVPGGDTVQMVETAKELEKLGADVHVCTVATAPSMTGYDVIHVFNWEQFEPTRMLAERLAPGSRPPIVLTPIFMFQFGHWFETAKTAKVKWSFLNSVAGDRLARLVYTRWQEWKFKRGDDAKRAREAAMSAAMLLPNSETEIAYAATMLDLNGRVHSRCAILVNGVPAERFTDASDAAPEILPQIPADGFVLQVARIQSEKNQLGLIKALFKEPIPVVFVGQPSPYEPDYVDRCRELGERRGNVHFLGSVPHSQLPGIYRRARVHVLPSFREVVPMVCLEAAAAGCRIVSTTVGGIQEYFGDLAWYCEPGDEDSIRYAVMDAWNALPDGSLRKLVLSKYTWGRTAAAAMDAYRRLLGEMCTEEACPSHQLSAS